MINSTFSRKCTEFEIVGNKLLVRIFVLFMDGLLKETLAEKTTFHYLN